MLNCIVCDDNKNAAGFIRDQLNDLFPGQFNIALKFDKEGFNNACKTVCDILIMDIDLKASDGVDSSGIDIAKHLKSEDPDMQVVFVSAFNEYAQDIFEADPVYFIQKPVNKEMLRIAVDKAMNRLEKIRNSMFTFSVGTEINKVRMSDILYFESEKRLMRLVTKNGQYSFYSRIRDVEDRLDSRFIKCHQSFIINMEHIVRFSGTFAETDSGNRVPVSQSRYREVRQAFTRYIGENIA